MNTTRISFLLLLVFQLSVAQEKASHHASGWYAYGLGSIITGAPLSWSKDFEFPEDANISASSAAMLLGVGHRFRFSDSNWYLEVQGDYGYGGWFSDWRVEDRGIHYYLVSVGVGYLFPDESFSLFAPIGLGTMVQSQYYDYDYSSQSGDDRGRYEYLEKRESLLYLGVGLKHTLSPAVLLRGEIRLLATIGDEATVTEIRFKSDGTSSPISYSDQVSAGIVFAVGLEVAF